MCGVVVACVGPADRQSSKRVSLLVCEGVVCVCVCVWWCGGGGGSMRPPPAPPIKACSPCPRRDAPTCARYDCRLNTARHWHNPHRISLIGRELAASNAASKLCVGVPLPRRSFTCLLLKLMLSLRSAMQVQRIAVTFHHAHVVAGPSLFRPHRAER